MLKSGTRVNLSRSLRHLGQKIPLTWGDLLAPRGDPSPAHLSLSPYLPSRDRQVFPFHPPLLEAGGQRRLVPGSGVTEAFAPAVGIVNDQQHEQGEEDHQHDGVGALQGRRQKQEKGPPGDPGGQPFSLGRLQRFDAFRFRQPLLSPGFPFLA